VPSRSRDAFISLAGALAEQPLLVRRLLARHPPTGTLCGGCCTPGGRIAVTAPCAIRGLAELAQQIIRGQATRADAHRDPGDRAPIPPPTPNRAPARRPTSSGARPRRPPLPM
jgi:hypothetical protein